MLKARRYTHPITLIFISSVTDDYGKGEISTSEDVLHTFADVVPTGRSRARIEGSNVTQEVGYKFTIRYTDKAFNAVRYNGVEYIANSMENINEESKEIVIYANRAE
jgi:hypothetical protein